MDSRIASVEVTRLNFKRMGAR